MTVQFEDVEYSVRESDGRVQVCAEIVSPPLTERVFHLLVTSIDRSASKNFKCPEFGCSVTNKSKPT